MNTNRSGISGNERPQQPTTSVTMLWNIVNGLKLVLSKEYKDEEEEKKDSRFILYQEAAAKFMEQYKRWVKIRIVEECRKREFFFQSGNDAKIEDVYLMFYQIAVDPKFGRKYDTGEMDQSSSNPPNIQKALAAKTEKGTPFISYVQNWIEWACVEWMSQNHFFRKKKKKQSDDSQPPKVISLDKVISSETEEENDHVSYLESNGCSIQEHMELQKRVDGDVHGFRTSAGVLEAKDLIEKIRGFVTQILIETARIPDNFESSNDGKIGVELTKEFIHNPEATQREIVDKFADKYPISQPKVSYYKRQWVEKKVRPQLRKYQPGHSKSWCIDNSPEIYELLVDFVNDRIGEKVL